MEEKIILTPESTEELSEIAQVMVAAIRTGGMEAQEILNSEYIPVEWYVFDCEEDFGEYQFPTSDKECKKLASALLEECNYINEQIDGGYTTITGEYMDTPSFKKCVIKNGSIMIRF